MSDKKETKLTLEQFKADNTELHEQIFSAGRAEGEKAERDTFAELQKACGDDNDLIVKCYSEGKTVTEALQMRAEKAEAENKELTEQLSKNSTETGKKKVDPAVTEFSDTATEPGKENQGEFNEAEATDEQLEEHFGKTKELQDEFGQVDYYVNFIKQQNAGRVKILH